MLTCDALPNIVLSRCVDPDVLAQKMLPFTFMYEPSFIYIAGKSSKSDNTVALFLNQCKISNTKVN